MKLQVHRWDKEAAPTEQELRECYRLEGLVPYAWSNGPGDTYSAHTHSYHKVIYVLRGSITWILTKSGKEIEIETKAGDRVDLPRGTVHAAQVGSQGVTCLEAHSS